MWYPFKYTLKGKPPEIIIPTEKAELIAFAAKELTWKLTTARRAAIVIDLENKEKLPEGRKKIIDAIIAECRNHGLLSDLVQSRTLGWVYLARGDEFAKVINEAHGLTSIGHTPNPNDSKAAESPPSGTQPKSGKAMIKKGNAKLPSQEL